MIVGFNTDIKHRGRTYHVQTEDHGLKNPLVESLVYLSGGRIIDKHQSRYEEMIDGGVDEARVVQLMENQHRRVIQLIKSDHYLSDEEKAQVAKEQEEKLRVIGAASEDERPFDELVGAWLDEQEEDEEIELIMQTGGPLVLGRKTELRLKVAKSVSRGAVAGARLRITLISTVGEPELLFDGETDRMGEARVDLTLPALEGGNAAIIVKCESEFGAAELRQLVQRAA